MLKINNLDKKRNLSDLTSNKRGRFNHLSKIPITSETTYELCVTCKSGHIKSMQVFSDQILGQGAFKICFKAEIVGGKQVKKKKAFLQVLPGDYILARKLLLANLQYSVLLRKEAEKHGRKDLFVKVSAVMQKNSDTMVGLIENLAQNTLFLEIQSSLTFQKINYIRDLLLAGEIMEKAGIFHRDLKPQNIFIINGSVCIGDFDFTTNESTQDTPAGTPGYLPPELLDNRNQRNYDLRIVKQDSYAMGMIFLQLLFKLDEAVCSQHQIHHQLNDLERVCAETPQLAKIIKGLLSTHASERLTMVQANQMFSCK